MMQHEYFLNRQIQVALYSLKRQYGGPITVFHVLSATTDPRTGEPTARYRATRVGRAIILPAQRTRELERNVSIISANKQMVSGGWYDATARIIIIDRRDAPSLCITQDDFLVYGGCKFALESIVDSAFSSAYLLKARMLSGESFDDTTLAQHLDASDEVEVVSTNGVLHVEEP